MYIYPGATILIKIACPDCGAITDNYQPQNSDFFILNCRNPECGLRGTSAVIEKRSGVVVSVQQWEFRGHDGVWYRTQFEKIKEEKS